MDERMKARKEKWAKVMAQKAEAKKRSAKDKLEEATETNRERRRRGAD